MVFSIAMQLLVYYGLFLTHCCEVAKVFWVCVFFFFTCFHPVAGEFYVVSSFCHTVSSVFWVIGYFSVVLACCYVVARVP